MKKMFMSLAALALIFASCSKNEVTSENSQNPNAIGFDMSTGKSRASINTVTNLQAGFTVYASKEDGTDHFIPNKTYKYTSGAWGWVGGDINWPDDGYKLNFYASYPTGLNISYEDLKVNIGTSSQRDYLAANKLDVAARPVSSQVSLNFKHILSKIDFQIVAGADYNVFVQSISVRNIGQYGEFDFASLTWSAAPTVFDKDHTYTTGMSEVEGVADMEPEAATAANGSLLVMPQDNSGRAWDKTMTNLDDQAYIEVVYRIEDKEGNNVIGFADAEDHPKFEELGNGEEKLFVKVAYPLNTKWLMQNGYLYTIYLDGDSSGGNLIDDTFIDEEGDPTDLPVVYPTDPTNPDDPGTPIDTPDPIFQNKPIGFTLSVSAWDDSGDDIDVK